MKPRRVTVQLEIQTEHSLTDLRNTGWWWMTFRLARINDETRVLQAQANVIRPEKKAAKLPGRLAARPPGSKKRKSRKATRRTKSERAKR